MPRLRTLAAVGVAAGIAALYLWRLGSAPLYLAHDEVVFAVESHSLATTLHDTSGQFLPLYVHNIYWTAPLHIYLTALLLRFVHLSDLVVRLPTVAMGLLAIALMYAVGKRLFQSAWYGLLAATLLALTPAQFLASRFKVESHFPVPFVVGWLVCVVAFVDTRRTGWLLAAGVVLGLGLYSYHAAPLIVPLYLIATVWLLWMEHEARRERIVPLISSFALLAIPYALFVVRHPDYITGEAATYGIFNDLTAKASESAGGLFTWAALKNRLILYYEYFSPSLLFFAGGSAVEESTQKAGVFLLALAALLPIGMYRILKDRSAIGWLCLVGFLTGPLAASIATDEGGATRRILFMLPFAGLIATYAAELLFNARQSWLRGLAVVLVAAVPLQFAFFYRDYLGDYQVRAAPWFDQNIRGALEPAIAIAARDEHAPHVFISTGMSSFIGWYWNFYTIKHDQQALRARTTFLPSKAVNRSAVDERAVIVAEAEARDRIVSELPDMTEIARAPEPQRPPSFFVWLKDR